MTQPSYALTGGQCGPRRPCPYVTRAARETKFSTIYRTHRAFSQFVHFSRFSLNFYIVEIIRGYYTPPN
ncbi:hypothetical protein HanXRQr2_Chr01g0011111 [Helianthus annuus]|uniref:Uncharacterized protein n=1 Tax=Helianthus annuus TaxID=4232 RepID=A0A251T094_HELAN|nr:hypothetical protein HanXRQr2_Chr01g0011111 [Helianthus annuus]